MIVISRYLLTKWMLMSWLSPVIALLLISRLFWLHALHSSSQSLSTKEITRNHCEWRALLMR